MKIHVPHQVLCPELLRLPALPPAVRCGAYLLLQRVAGPDGAPADRVQAEGPWLLLPEVWFGGAPKDCPWAKVRAKSRSGTRTYYF